MLDSVTQPQPTLSGTALRVVLFGMPDAGKSSLLGGLAQAAEKQELLLHGRVVDRTQGLAELQRRVYEDSPRETLEEVVPYPVCFEPFSTTVAGKGEKWEALLVDCDGRAANELLSRRKALDGETGANGLAGAILQADTLLLVLDVSAPPSQVDSDFAEFGRFLKFFEHSRGVRTDVGGLPVYLVLTKCDLLAQPGDTPETWIERIEARKREVHERFQEFLARQHQGPTAFGRITLRLAATAVKLPDLEGRPARPDEPFGIADLFRGCFEAARLFRRRREQSSRRLLWMVSGLVTLVLFMAVAAGGLFHFRTSVYSNPLAAKVELLRAREGQTVSARLREPLQRKIAELTEIKNDPEFASLPEPDQTFVQDRLEELRAYSAFKDRLQRIQVDGARNDADLDRLHKQLAVEMAPPDPYAADWDQTEAVFLRDRLLHDVDALRAAVDETKHWRQQNIEEAERLRTFQAGKPGNAREWREWYSQSGALLDKTPPHTESEWIPGSDHLTYATVFRFDGVAKARLEWEAVKKQLEQLRNLTVLLGLAVVPDKPALLEIPFGFQPDQAPTRVQELDKAYPGWQQEIPSIHAPDAAAGDIHEAAKTSLDHLLDAGRDVVGKHVQQAAADGDETPALWQGLLKGWLSSATDLRDWNALAVVLGRFQGSDAKDPLVTLRDFLKQESFHLEIQRLTVEIPFDTKVHPDGPLTLYYQPAGKELESVTFNLQDEDGQRDAQRRITSYTFSRPGELSLTYRPGDSLWAALPVKREGDAGAWLLTWARSRSQVYQFERLVRPPRLHRKEEKNTEGALLESIRLTVTPQSGVPKLPELIPVVNLRK